MNKQDSEHYEFLCAIFTVPHTRTRAEAKWGKDECLRLLNEIYCDGVTRYLELLERPEGGGWFS